MKFSGLPWFIRKNIINIVIEDYPGYLFINKEWLIQAAKLHGQTILNNERPSQDIRTPPYDVYFGSIWFGRFDNIDWDVICSYKSLQTATFYVGSGDTKVKCSEFNDKLILLPLLKKVTIMTNFQGPSFDFSPFLKTQNMLKELITPLDTLIRCFNVEPNSITFPILTNLTVTDVNPTFNISQITREAPKLRILNIDSCQQTGGQVSFKDDIVYNVTELNINYFYNDRIINLDLSKWPNLKKIDTNCALNFADSNSFANVEDLSLEGSVEYITSVVSAEFCKLTRLSLYFHSTPGADVIYKVLKLCTSLTTLKLSISEGHHLLRNLLIAPCTITDLTLKGEFYITSNLLRWLSDNFKLKKLKFIRCLKKENAHIEPASFDTLDHLEIFTYRCFEFKSYFNRTIYPHVSSIVIGRSCESCSYESERYVEPKLENTENTHQPVFLTRNFL